ncbi:MAG: hypothetical protein PHH83_03985 [Patescibacteria group bacterium]|nr:hypothetical protein [Patescibacteria group bacterium]
MKIRVFAIEELFPFFLILGTIVLLYDGAFYRYLENCIFYLNHVFAISNCLSIRLILATFMFVLFLIVCWLGAFIFHFLSLKFNKLLGKK